MSTKHFVAGSLATTALTAAVVLSQSMFGASLTEVGPSPDEARYLPTVNSALAMQVVGASEGMKKTGWSNHSVEHRVAELEDRVRPELKERFDHIRKSSYAQALAGDWNERALEQFIAASIVSTDSILDVNADVFSAGDEDERLAAQHGIFDRYAERSPYVGIAMVQMGEMFTQLHEAMEDRGMLEISQADPAAISNPNFKAAFNEILGELSFNPIGPLPRTMMMENGIDPFSTFEMAFRDPPPPITMVHRDPPPPIKIDIRDPKPKMVIHIRDPFNEPDDTKPDEDEPTINF